MSADNDWTKQKQNYLREEIIAKGYGAPEFVDFLASKKENGADIEMWALQELKDMVKAFQDQTDKKDSSTMDQSIRAAQEQQRRATMQLEITSEDEEDNDQESSAKIHKEAIAQEAQSRKLIETQTAVVQQSISQTPVGLSAELTEFLDSKSKEAAEEIQRLHVFIALNLGIRGHL